MKNIRKKSVSVSDTTNPKDLIGLTKCPLRLVPPCLEVFVAMAMKHGAEKYGPFNWRDKKVRTTVYTEAIRRHLKAYEDGEDNDPESHFIHLSHIGACIAILLDAGLNDCLIDDRFKSKNKSVSALLKLFSAQRK